MNVNCEYLREMGDGYRPLCKKHKFVVTAHCERCDLYTQRLKAQVEALKDYAHALELCMGESQLCEYCTFNGIDFNHDDIHCTIDFDGLRKKAGMEQ